MHKCVKTPGLDIHKIIMSETFSMKISGLV